MAVGLGCRGREAPSLLGEECGEALPFLLGIRWRSDLSSGGVSSSLSLKSSSSSSPSTASSLRIQPRSSCPPRAARPPLCISMLPLLSLSSMELDRENGFALAMGERASVSTRCRFVRSRDNENDESSPSSYKCQWWITRSFRLLLILIHTCIDTTYI